MKEKEVYDIIVHPVLIGTKEFWRGVILIIASVAYEVASFTFPFLNIPLSYVTEYFYSNSFLQSIPLIPLILLVIGFIEIIAGELRSRYERLMANKQEVAIVKGFIITDRSVFLPHKITDVRVKRNLLDVILGTGSIVLRVQDIPNDIEIGGIKKAEQIQAKLVSLVDLSQGVQLNDNQDTNK